MNLRDARFATLLAVSDALVMTACQRAYSRSISRRTKFVPMRDRHHAYEHFPIPEDKVEAALEDAWSLCQTLNARHDLAVDVDGWTRILDGYTRSLLLMSVPHTAQRLTPYLEPLVATGRGALSAVR